MFKKILFTALGILLLAGVIVGIKVLQIRAMIAAGADAPKPVESVSTALVETDRWVRSIESVGSFRAVQGADLSTETSGIVSGIHFENGAEVREGDLLVELDTSGEEATLRSAVAEADLARTVYERTKMLRASNAMPQSDLDAAASQLRKVNALVEQLRATISKKQLRAPFSGRLGIREVNLGQFIQNGDKIVSLQSLDPIYIDFLLPQQLISTLAAGQKILVRTDAYPGRVFEGELTAINSEVDRVTRNIRLQGTLQNPDGSLRPGMFARVEIFEGGEDEVLRIPLTALFRAPYGDSVFVVLEKPGPDGAKETVVEQRFIRAGRAVGDFVSVVEGLKEGDTVVTAGAFKLRNGSAVRVDNSLAPQPTLSPSPENS
jgi:membrane fusion protein (multidrug efflux system)